MKIKNFKRKYNTFANKIDWEKPLREDELNLIQFKLNNLPKMKIKENLTRKNAAILFSFMNHQDKRLNRKIKLNKLNKIK